MDSNLDDDLHLLQDDDNNSGRIIGTLEVEPRGQERFQLGFYTSKNPPKGFYTEVSSGARPVNSVVTRIVSVGTDKRYRLILHVANFSDQTVSVKIGKLEDTEQDTHDEE